MTAEEGEDAASGIVAIAGPAWRMAIWPALGGALVSAKARHGEAWLDVTPPVVPEILAQRDILKLGGFPLAPFCNRIDGAAFPFDGATVGLPRNWPADPAVSIHGLSWQRPWAVERHSASRLDLAQTVDGSGSDFRYAAQLVYDLTGMAAAQTLSIRNIGEKTLPFGLGFHPYFRRTPQATVAFEAGGWLESDARCFPVRCRPIAEHRGLRAACAIEDLAGMDASFTGWAGQAVVTWPELEARLILDASAAAKLLHVFVPADGQPFLCLEPVSHVIDVHHRRHLAAHGDATPLAPGETLSLAMTWRLG